MGVTRELEMHFGYVRSGSYELINLNRILVFLGIHEVPNVSATNHGKALPDPE